MTCLRAPSVRLRRRRRALETGASSAGPVAWAVVAVLLLAGSARGAGTGAHGYNEANALYRQGEFKKAAGRYEEVVSQGVRNGNVFFNLGNAWFKAGEIGQAILAYERALKLMPGDEDVLSNLRFVNAHKEDKSPEEDVNLPTRLLSSAYRVLSANVLAVLSSISLFLMSAAAVLWLYSIPRRSLSIGLLVLAGVGLCGSGSLLTYRSITRPRLQKRLFWRTRYRDEAAPGTTICSYSRSMRVRRWPSNGWKAAGIWCDCQTGSAGGCRGRRWRESEVRIARSQGGGALDAGRHEQKRPVFRNVSVSHLNQGSA